MKWIVFWFLVVALARLGEGGAIRCQNGSQGDSCTTEEKEIGPPLQIAEGESEKTVLKSECVAGSEWDSNCTVCRCSESGVANCLARYPCDDTPNENQLKSLNKNGSIDVSVQPVTKDVQSIQEEEFGKNNLEEATAQSILQDPTLEKDIVLNKPEFSKPDTSKDYEIISQTQNVNKSIEGDTENIEVGLEQNSDNRNAKYTLSDTTEFYTVTLATDPTNGLVGDTTEIYDLNLTTQNSQYDSTQNIEYSTRNTIDVGPQEITENAFEYSTTMNTDYTSQTNVDYTTESIKETTEVVPDDNKGSDLKETKENFSAEHTVKKRSVCKANQSFKSECNSCKCAANGQSYSCTQNECMEDEPANKEVEVFMENEGADHIERHSVCKPRGTFYIGCNTCHCNNYGTDYSCTNKPCPLPEDVELFHELKGLKSSNSTKPIVCAANRMFIKDCNTCWCNEDGTGFFCTRKVCVDDLPDEDDKPEELRIIKRQCRPNEVFELDCNMCRCNPDGNSFSCTRRACLSDEDVKNSSLSRKTRGVPPQETPKKCQPSKEFRVDCNKCLCDPEGFTFSCTRFDCMAPASGSNVATRTRRDVPTSENITMECSAGSVFNRDCNVCRCADDGKFAICTIKRCQLPKNKDDLPTPDSDPGFRCDPGEQFRRECNDCTCSADGKSVFCTLRLCDADTIPGI